MFSSVAADSADRRAVRQGDEFIARPDVVMDRTFTVAAPPAAVWPWLVQPEETGWLVPSGGCRALPVARASRGAGHPAGLKERLAQDDARL
jgi:hypothetical protein